jgi:hypothetical protein
MSVPAVEPPFGLPACTGALVLINDPNPELSLEPLLLALTGALVLISEPERELPLELLVPLPAPMGALVLINEP